MEAVRDEHDLHQPAEKQDRRCRHRDTPAAPWWTLRTAVFATHDLRGCDVRRLVHSASPELFLHLLLCLGSVQSILERASNASVVQGDVLGLPERKKSLHPVFNLNNLFLL